MQTRERNDEGMGRDRKKKTDCGGFFCDTNSRFRETGNTDGMITCQSVNKSIKVACACVCVFSVSSVLVEKRFS